MVYSRNIAASDGCAGVDDVEVDGDGSSSSSVGGGSGLELDLLGDEVSLHLGEGRIIDVRAASTSNRRVVVRDKSLYSKGTSEES